MPSLPSLAARASLLALLGASPLWCQDPTRWSRVENLTDNNYTVVNTDKAYTRGMLFIRKVGEKGSGVLLDEGGKSTVLEAKKNYEFNLATKLTQANQLAMKIRIQNAKDTGDSMDFRFSNLGSSAGLAETLELNAYQGGLKSWHVLIDPSAFRNTTGTLFTIK